MTWQPDYITAAQLAAYAKADADRDAAELAVAVSAASRAIDRECHRQFGQSAAGTSLVYDLRWSHYQGGCVALVDDYFGAPSLVEVDDGSGTYVAYSGPVVALPENAALGSMPYTRIVLPGVTQAAFRRALRVTHQWGWPAYPKVVIQAAYLQSSRLLFRKDSPAGIAGSPDAGSELRLLARVDPDVAVVLAGYVREPTGTR